MKSGTGMKSGNQESSVYIVNVDSAKKMPEATPYNVYDPRSNGYGDSRRGYIHKMTGQPRFAYDDVDAIRMPNYITRNNIDFMKHHGTTYGQVKPTSHTDPMLLRKHVHREYLNNQLNFRNSLQSSWMVKGNNKRKQQKEFPIHF